MTDGKWKIVSGSTTTEFYEQVEKYERRGYKLIPESFRVYDKTVFYILMKRKELFNAY